ncbi:uncharacterized protein LOC106660182 isoform X2 [Trichogramma pretiosum]|uniref:uncharacterized protein LOC106660182 isoform X2 n=1 Tax=Trichogramma pretiosum TaxID=7493 RepID=UPI000C719204|nr:uncharacterized protein LOC106660182 isoform X2 [Trichogramma pretiosum]
MMIHWYMAVDEIRAHSYDRATPLHTAEHARDRRDWNTLKIRMWLEESEDDVIYKAEYCRTTEVLKNRCQIEKCNQEDTRYLVIGCPTFKCSDKILGTRQDASKPYPHCCPVPDCS